jgi:tetratricopeptide (TPR) repeat protein
MSDVGKVINLSPYTGVVNDYIAAKNWEAATKACLEGMNAEPDNEQLLMAFGFINMQVRNFGLGRHILRLLKNDLGSTYPVVHNLGLAEICLAPFSGQEKFLAMGEENLKKALKKVPSSCQSINGLAQINLHRGNWQTCIEYAEKSLAMNPDQPGLQETYGMALLALWRFGEGFKNSDAHIPSMQRKPLKKGDEPYWDGTKGMKLLVQGEQGIGDEITYAGSVFDAARDNEILLECDPRLEKLFKRSFGHVCKVEPTRKLDRNWKFEPEAMCLSGTLSTHYRKTPEDYPRAAFLEPDPDLRVMYRALLDTLPGRKIGIAWKGGIPMNFSGRRSLNLSQLHPLLNMPGITWISLEYKDPSDEIASWKRKNPGTSIVHWERAVGKGCDYDETAALVSELDAVVSVCTSVVHLCGALGKTCHVLVPKIPRWFYESKTQKHAVYDSLILHREKNNGWPLQEVCESLSTATTEKSPLAALEL